MVFFIFSILVALLCAFLIYKGVSQLENGILAVGIVIIIFDLVINICAFACSFSKAVDVDVIHDGLIAEYKSAITVYQNKTVINVADLSLTDFKYEGYQKNISDMIISVRNLVHRHNQLLIEKRAYKDNIFFGFYISMPKSNALIHMIEEKK